MGWEVDILQRPFRKGSGLGLLESSVIKQTAQIEYYSPQWSQVQIPAGNPLLCVFLPLPALVICLLTQ